ncbi:DNA ligase 1-like [Perca fluviatilis]|uniref:DNA ligase 1-like n=1 Tax=Perca fluviatilis TaxID=8168 RepID=UPI0019639B8A|nr:DNA ligase 1-like [Perca fluviatilis]
METTMGSTPQLQANTTTPIPLQHLCSVDMEKRVEDSQHALSIFVPAMQQVLLSSKAENKKLATENAALRKWTAIKQLRWEQEKKKLLYEKDFLVSTLNMAKCDMVKALVFARASQKKFDTQGEGKKDKLRSLTESLYFHMMETEKVKKSWKAEWDQLSEMKLSFDKMLIQLNKEWESRAIARQKEVAAELETLQQDCEKKVSQVIQEKDEVIASVRKEMMALIEGNLESLAKVRALETQICQRQTEEKEESFKKIQELQKQSREVEEKWLIKEQEWLNKEYALKTNKEKAKMAKDEKKAKKETEKRLKKEKKEADEREKKEREENARKDKKRLKTEKKENKEREKKEK